MSWSVIKQLIKKELLTLIRNKRVLIGLVAPLILLPVLIYGFQQITEMTHRSSEETKSNIILKTGEQELPQDLKHKMNKNEQIKLYKYETGVEERTTDLIFSYEYTNDRHLIELTYDSGRNSGLRAVERIMPILDEFKELEQIRLLEMHGSTENILNSIVLNTQDVSTAKEQSNYSLSGVLPLILTLYALLSVVNFAIELSTAEKEMGTLETLFSVPVKTVEVVIAKLLSCILLGIISMLLSLIILFLILPQMIGVDSLGGAMELSNILIVLIALLPLIFIGAGASIGVGMFANSYKESGAYLTPLIFVFMIPAYIGATPGVELTPIYTLIPIINATLLIKSVFLENLNISLLLLTFVVNGMFSVLSLLFLFKVFGEEQILFGVGKGTTFRLNRKELSKRNFIEVEDALVSLAVMTILFIYLSTILSGWFDAIHSTVIVQYTIFGAMPLGILWYLKASFKKSLGLRKPLLTDFIGGIGLWLATIAAIFIYQMSIMPFIEEAPNLVELEAQIKSLSLLGKFFVIALTPGICEELFFRGLILRSLEKSWGAKWAIIISALAFAIIHLDIVRLVPTFLLGLTFGYITVKSRSIFPAIFLHVLNNSMAVFLPSTIELKYGWLMIMFVVSLAIGIGIFQRKRFYR
ncbi:ABC transporter permease subunit/CPBP intramembrane protease [Serpentinicella sp. ANB-PHB4]|uniref:ABC transporter permease subunit/CPBP intramembrane protease n=1 Tax=Serpentinicella sp. ANB-PHB4 TaxID=3074076 RepID=UPI00286010C1|nr:ABC transporter permease subunit/CPBP intramembrane protease [Serpentinicella sp. ANB-PHB4]MDR5659076.1 ABC transporter permease subunit/CPBP intramembrane protease [Serpentinicella sp. ANB-PHB4]